MTPSDHGTTLVTGGAGFIGSALVWALNRRGIGRILIVDRLGCSEKWRNLTPLAFDDYLEADALLPAIARGVLDDVRTVFHLGACSSTTETDASFLVRNNFELTKTLAEWSLQRGARFVYASSAATYGALEGDLAESIELTTLRPLNMYGYSKHLFDLHASRRGYLDRILGLKYFNVFGPNEDHKGDMRSMVHKAFQQIRDTGRVRLFKSDRPEFRDGEQVRDFIYVKDAVAMTLHAAARSDLNGLVNVGSGRAHTWIDLANAVFDACGVKRDIEFVDMPAHLRGKYQYATRAVVDRIKRSGYNQPITPLADAIADYVRNYLMTDRRLGDETSVRPPDQTPQLREA
ncbi:MAG TPA: ADP-glyceromanno-heptose 6-epimerase [Vicinamibacterales bacterium]|nr:ADP-glyceromanno-heptose 6-epimerase [Vicinamibacterales bacterium]